MNDLFHKTTVKIISHNLIHDWYAPFRSPYENESIGTGFFIKNGYILTCCHVVEDAIKIEITIPSIGKNRYEAKIISISSDYDLAILKTDYINENFLELTNSDLINQGDTVYAIGYPLGQDRLKISQGIISGYQGHLFQTDAPINPGNSGGPLINKNNQVIAINSQKIAANSADNIGYSVPTKYFQILINNFINESNSPNIINKPRLLCKFSNIDQFILEYNNLNENNNLNEKKGYLIYEINEHSSLYKIGIRQYDILFKIDEYDIDNYGEVTVTWSKEKFNINDILYRYKIGDSIKITYYNKEKGFKDTSIKLEYPKFIIDNIYLNINKINIDYEIISGMVFTNLKLNHAHVDQLIGSNLSHVNKNKLMKITEDKNKFTEKLLLCNILPGSYTYSIHNDIETGLYLEKIDDIEICNLDQLRNYIFKHKDNNLIKLTFENSKIIILSFNNIQSELKMIYGQYKIPKSEFMQKLFGNYQILYKNNSKKNELDKEKNV